jgi:hypothetical protein
MNTRLAARPHGALVAEVLDVMTNDSENVERAMRLLTEDCVWVLEPYGVEFHGAEEVKAFIQLAMSTRGHAESGGLLT